MDNFGTLERHLMFLNFTLSWTNLINDGLNWYDLLKLQSSSNFLRDMKNRNMQIEVKKHFQMLKIILQNIPAAICVIHLVVPGFYFSKDGKWYLFGSFTHCLWCISTKSGKIQLFQLNIPITVKSPQFFKLFQLLCKRIQHMNSGPCNTHCQHMMPPNPKGITCMTLPIQAHVRQDCRNNIGYCTHILTVLEKLL